MNVAILHSVVREDSPYTVSKQLLHKRHLNIDINIHLMLQQLRFKTRALSPANIQGDVKSPRRSPSKLNLKSWKLNLNLFHLPCWKWWITEDNQFTRKLMIFMMLQVAATESMESCQRPGGTLCHAGMGQSLWWSGHRWPSGACSTKEWMDAAVSAKSLHGYTRQFPRWYDRHILTAVELKSAVFLHGHSAQVGTTHRGTRRVPLYRYPLFSNSGYLSKRWWSLAQLDYALARQIRLQHTHAMLWRWAALVDTQCFAKKNYCHLGEKVVVQ